MIGTNLLSAAKVTTGSEQSSVWHYLVLFGLPYVTLMFVCCSKSFHARSQVL